MTAEPEAPTTEVTSPDDRPWESLEQLIESGDFESAGAFVENLADADCNVAICRLKPEHQVVLMAAIGREEAAELLEHLPEEQSVSILEELSATEAAEILEEMPADDRADLVGALDEEDSEAILEEMRVEESQALRELIQYDPLSAGGMMSPEIIHFEREMTVGDALLQMAAYEPGHEEIEVQYFYVVDESTRLVGVVPLRDLVSQRRSTRLANIMVKSPITVQATDMLEDLLPVFDGNSFLGLPVIDEESNLLGILSRESVLKAKEKRARNIFLKVSGIIGGEELRHLSLGSRCVRRLSFLAPNIILNLVAASVIAFYQDTIAAVIALAVFLPIVSDMSGCSGNQAVAVSIRELSLGLIKPKEVWRVFCKEGGVGLINGAVLGILLGTVAAMWQQNAWLGLVIGGALAANTLLSVLLGGLIPLVLKGFKVDPALASGPILTTVTDMCGFFLVLNFASLALSQLT